MKKSIKTLASKSNTALTIPTSKSKKDMTVIPESELQRMKNNAVVISKEELLEQKKISEEQKNRQQAVARAKKEKMLKAEEEKKKIVQLTETQKEEQVVKESMKHKAKVLMNEQLDEVKNMNSMIMYAKCVTVRDQQLMEKERLLVFLVKKRQK